MSTNGPRTYTSHIVRYAAGQFLANAAYDLALKPVTELDIMKVAGSENTGHHAEYERYLVHPFKLKKGMFAYMLVPKDKSLKDVKVTFRGTDFDDLHSAAINLETWGPGTASFEAEKDNIFKTFEQVIEQHYGSALPDLTLEVCGHSQGAALSQLFVTEFLTKRAFNDKFSAFKNLNMTIFNSPGVPHSTAKAAMEAVLLQWYEQRPMNIVANYCMVGGDAVQTTGNNSIFAMLSPFLATVNLLKVDIGMEGSWLKGIRLADGLQPIELWDTLWNIWFATLGAHTSLKFYDPETKNIKIGFNYQYYSNQNPGDIPTIRKELLNKALLSQYALFLLKLPLHHFIENKKDYELWFGKTYVNSAYQKLSSWFSRHADKIAQEDLQSAKTFSSKN